jgi:ketosteroid isomerase-like protein
VTATNADEVLALAARFTQALNAADGDAVREIYSDDAKIWHNFDQAYQSVEENIRTLAWLHRVLSDVDYDIQRVEVTSDGFFQQHVLRGKLASGEAFAMPACAICKVDNGKIVALEEYLDLAHTKPLMA